VRRRHGFTLIELIVATVILAVTAIYLLETFTANQRSYTALDQTVESQQNLRAVSDLIERDLRHAGLMVPPAAAICGVDLTNGPDRLYVSDAEAIDPGDDLLSYDGAEILGGVTNVTSGSTETLSLSGLILEPAPPTRAAYDTDDDGTDDSDFQVDAGVIIADRNDPARGVACGPVLVVDTAAEDIQVLIASSGLDAPTKPVELVAIPATEYRVSNQAELLRNGVPLARGIEDLQVAYLFDLNGDGVLAGSEARGVPGANYVASEESVEDLGAVRINFVARTRGEDPTFAKGAFIARENRAAVAGDDHFRRRAHTTTIMPRNLVNRMEES
jgi:prepilin-type N-terminal cleavage/methylation domain-containing protein